MRAPWISSLFFAFFLIISSIATQPTENPLETWTNNESSINSTSFTDGSKIRAIIRFSVDDSPTFTCGFFCNGTCTSYIFAILISLPISYQPQGDLEDEDTPVVIWSANRDDPVSNGAILNLTKSGGFVLQDVDGSIVWTTNITNKSIDGLALTTQGNLMLLDVHNLTVWQSFEHPTDCLVPGQKLFPGQKLIPSVSSTNLSSQKDLYSLLLNDEGLFAYVESNPPQTYFHRLANTGYINQGMAKFVSDYVEFIEPNLYLCTSSTDQSNMCLIMGSVPQTLTLRYIKLMPYGHLKAVGWDRIGNRDETDLLTDDDLGECSYPLTCARNAICLANQQQCSCPGIDTFRAVDGFQPNKGCFPVTPLTCNANATQHQYFIELKNVTYITYSADMENVDLKTCKQACLNNCSCKAAIFNYNGSNSLRGSCDLPSELFTMSVHANNTSVFIKVQNVTSTPLSIMFQPQTPIMFQPQTPEPEKKNRLAMILGSTIGSFVLLLIVVVGFTKFILQKQKTDGEMEEEYLDQMPGMPTRFSYEELKAATENFNKKLGEGGFGSVFEGTLEDGSRIAVKCLQGLVHVKESFLAEVESIGSIHHVNLVRLRGFCAWKSERLLVYDFMSNGSLDEWIYYGERKHVLGWECRKKIILDIAKGLAYLHEECRQKIIHLDIKPQNILLDEDFNAKVSDFGLSKLIDRNQS